MSRMVNCIKLNKEAPGLEVTPYPGPLGERIYNEVSAEAWQMWLSHQTLLINEHRLSLIDPKAREFLMGEMEKFLFTGHFEMPEGYRPPSPDE